VLPAARRRRSTCMNLRPLRVVLLVIPPVRELDLVGIVDVFATANAFLPSDRHYHLELVTSNAHGTIQGMCGLQFAGARHYSTLEGEIDTLLVPGVQPEKVQLSPALPAVVSITGERMPSGGVDLYGGLHPGSSWPS
jgi:transcriptional regulator GlxA family with amidase domain